MYTRVGVRVGGWTWTPTHCVSRQQPHARHNEESSRPRHQQLAEPPHRGFTPRALALGSELPVLIGRATDAPPALALRLYRQSRECCPLHFKPAFYFAVKS